MEHKEAIKFVILGLVVVVISAAVIANRSSPESLLRGIVEETQESIGPGFTESRPKRSGSLAVVEVSPPHFRDKDRTQRKADRLLDIICAHIKRDRFWSKQQKIEAVRVVVSDPKQDFGDVTCDRSDGIAYSHDPDEKGLASEYGPPWKDTPNRFWIAISQTMVANNIRGCGEFKYKQSNLNDSRFLVRCTRDGKNWKEYLMHTDDREVIGPTKPDPAYD